jgi:uncharacterized protein (TIGR02099 family)
MNDSPPHPPRLLKAYAACAKWSLWLLAAFWLLLALAWGALHGWIVPRISEWRPMLEAQATRALGVPVRIGAVSARSDGLLPTVEFDGVVLLDPQGREALRLPKVVTALSPRSLWHRGFDQLYIEGPVLDIRRTTDGRVFVAGLDVGRGSAGDSGAADWFFQQSEIVLRGGQLRWTDEMRRAPELVLSGVELVVRNTARRHAVRLDGTLPDSVGGRFTLIGAFRQPLLSTHAGRWRDWDGQVHADFGRIDLGELRRYAPLPASVEGGRGAVRAWIDVAKGEVTGGVADLAVTAISTRLAPDLPPLALASLAGRLGVKRPGGGFEVQTQDLQFVTAEGQRWPGGNVFVAWTPADGKRPEAGEVRADRLDLAALGELAERLPLGAATHAALVTYAPRGLVDSLQARWQGPLQAPIAYQAKGRVSGLHVAAVAAAQPAAAGRPVPGTPGVRNLAADFDFSEAGGKARLALQDGAVELPGVFDEPVLALDRLAGDLQWQRSGGRLAVTASNVKFANADAEGEVQASWHSGADASRRSPGVIDLQGTLSRADGTRVWRYLPLRIPQTARDYVHDAVQQADVTDAKFRLKGDLRDFPFANGKAGEFKVTAQVRNATYAFAPRTSPRPGALPWPVLTQLSGQLVIDRLSLRVNGAEGRFAGAPGLRVQAQAEVADLAHATVEVAGEVRGPLGEALAVVQRSPVSALAQDALARATATGTAEVRLKLSLPVAQLDRTRVLGSVALGGNDIQITPDSPALSRARGTVSFSERGFTLANAQARALGGDVRLEGGTRTTGADAAVVVRAQGIASAEGLRQARELGFLSRLARQASGSAAYAATLTFRRGTPEILVTSTLQGLGLNLPAPMAKAADAVLPLRYENALVRDGAAIDQLSVDIGRLLSIHYVRDVSGAEPKVLRGALAIGLPAGETVALPEQGVAANIALGSANIDAWEDALEGVVTAPTPAAAATQAQGALPQRGAAAAIDGLGYLPTTLALRARELTVEGRTLHNLVVGGTREGLVWRANVDADELGGYVEYRQASGAGAGRVYARLARLSIAGAAATAVETLLDEQPGAIPALDVVVDDFELRGRKLGRLEIEAINRGGGAVAREGGVREWRLNKLSLLTPEAAFTATGNWAALDAQAQPPGARPPPRAAHERRRTVMNFRLDVQDGGQLLNRMGMKDVLRRGQGRLEGQIAWVGSPLGFDYPSMTGAFHVNIEGGQFLKADPGLAKLLGVLSLQSLPRRLALDFRDVFSQGFAFDFLRGDVTVQQGIAATNNLQMKGVNAAVLMEGRADLARETQDLRVVVVPEINAGTASLVAVAINPAIGIGTFLAQIFLREPLARANTQQFQIDGTWADPRITKIARPAPDTRSVGAAGDQGASR